MGWGAVCWRGRIGGQAELEDLRGRLKAALEDASRADAARRQSAGLAEEFRRAMDAAKRALRAHAARARRRERAARTGERREWEARLERLVARLGGAARECTDLSGRLEQEHLLRQVCARHVARGSRAARAGTARHRAHAL